MTAAGRTLVVIPCSQRKEGRGEPGLAWRRERSALARLSDDRAEVLLGCRRRLAALVGCVPAADLGFPTGKEVALMPAHRRYTGNLYRQLDAVAWSRLGGSGAIELVIVSALYGLVVPDEAIRHYNLTMTEAIAPRLRLARWWSQQGLGGLLADYAKRQSIKMIHDLLTEAYAEAIGWFEAVRGTTLVQSYAYPGKGSGANHYRGRDVRALISRAC